MSRDEARPPAGALTSEVRHRVAFYETDAMGIVHHANYLRFFERGALDEFALESHQRAIRATQTGAFDDEILPVSVLDPDSGEQIVHTVDEGIRFDATLDSIASVKLLAENGRISAATASQICDGASGMMVVSEAGLKRLGVEPLARIHHMSVMGHDPVIMLEAPLPATHRALDRAGMTIDDIDLFEVNEAFAPIPLAWLQSTGADPERMNVNGGAIALGHPVGATGAILTIKLMSALERLDQRRSGCESLALLGHVFLRIS